MATLAFHGWPPLTSLKTVCTLVQDVVVRGGKALPLYSRMVEAAAPRTVVLPASAALDPAALRPGTSTTFPGSGASSSPSTNPAVTLRDGDLWWASFLALPGSQGEAEVQAVAAAAAAAAGAGSAGAQAGAAGGQAAGSLLGLGTPAPAWLHLEADPSEPTNCLFSSGTTVSTQLAVTLLSHLLLASAYPAPQLLLGPRQEPP